MFDTNIFNTILDETFAVDSISANMVLYATRVQFDEISNTNKKERRERLLAIFKQVPQRIVGTETFLLNESWLNQDNVGPAIGFDILLAELDSREKKSNNYRDALIGETALKRNLILVTDDSNFREVMIAHGGASISWGKFKEMAKGHDSK